MKYLMKNLVIAVLFVFLSLVFFRDVNAGINCSTPGYTPNADEVCFSWDDLITGPLYPPGVKYKCMSISFSQGELDGAFYGDTATADKICQLKGYFYSTRYNINYACWASPFDNFFIRWNTTTNAWVQFDCRSGCPSGFYNYCVDPTIYCKKDSRCAMTDTCVCNQFPTVSDPKTTPDWCSKDPGKYNEGKVTLEWKFVDPEGDPQKGFNIQIKDENGNQAGDRNCSYYNTIVPSGGTGTTKLIVNLSNDSDCNTESGVIELEYGKKYFWQVAAKTNSDPSNVDWSNSVGGSFITPSKPYPYVRFTHSPTVVKPNQLITFTDNSLCYKDSTSGMISCLNSFFKTPVDSVTYSWNFNEGDSVKCDPNHLDYCSTLTDEGNVGHRYTTVENVSRAAVLEVTHDLNTCPYSQNIAIGDALKPPVWIEITPFK